MLYFNKRNEIVCTVLLSNSDTDLTEIKPEITMYHIQLPQLFMTGYYHLLILRRVA